MSKIINRIKKIVNFKILTQDKINDLVLSRVDKEVTAFRKSHEDRFNAVNESGSSPLFNSTEQHVDLFNSEGAVVPKAYQNVSNPHIKEIINSSFDMFPNEEISDSELMLIQEACRTKYNTDLIWQGAVDSFVDYVVGTGTKISSPVPEINYALNKFRKLNKFSLKERGIVKSSFLDGEYFAILFPDKEGYYILRKGHPKTIKEIETDPFDSEAVYGYHQEFYTLDVPGHPGGTLVDKWIHSLDYEKLIAQGRHKSLYESEYRKNSKVFCKMLKFNEPEKLRGLPPGRSILKGLKLYENFILDRMVLNHERAKVVWFKKILGRNDENYGTSPRVAPRQGTMMVETENISYRTEKPNLESSEAKEDALNLLYYCGSGIRFPLHIFNQRTDHQNYASIRKADSPFSTMISGYQLYYALEFDEIYRAQVSNLVKNGTLKGKYSYPSYSEDSIMFAIYEAQELADKGASEKDILSAIKKTLNDGVEEVIKDTLEIPISQDFPQIIWQDPKEMAEVMKIHSEMGIVSKSTLAARAGYVWEKEFSKRLIESIREEKITENADTDIQGNKKKSSSNKNIPATKSSKKKVSVTKDIKKKPVIKKTE
ncbi:MAG: hypothetical protein NUV97_01385 [archaeon]|nr:hypothetical protein [archaeon]